MSDMKFKNTEKEIIKAIVKYGNNEKSLAEVLHQGKLLENRGIAIIYCNNMYYVFLDKSFYGEEETNKAFGYISELMSLVKMLIENRYIVMIPFANSYTQTIGVYGFRGIKPNIFVTENGDYISLGYRDVYWPHEGEQKCWPSVFDEKQMPLSHFFDYPFSVSQELKELVKHNFKTEEQRRFSKQQFATWVSIAVAIILGLLGFLR